MRRWKITVEFENRIFEEIIESVSYTEAYINIEVLYPGCRVLSISEVRG